MRAKQPARKKKIPASVVRGLSRDLAAFGSDLEFPPDLRPTERLRVLSGKPKGRTPPSGAQMVLSLGAVPPGDSWWDRKRDALLKRATELRDKYRNNPYITVAGFSIEIGISPSLTIDFEFK